MSELEKYKLKYEHHMTNREIKKLFSNIRKYNRARLATIRKLAKQGTPLKDLAKSYDMTVQKIVTIIRSKK